jgi:general nucleoside transport system permease protein
MMPEAAGEAMTAPRRGFFQSSVRSLESVAEALLVPAVALAASLALFGVFLALIGTDPFAVYVSIYQGAFGSWFSWQNTLARAGPLMLTALCTALPARLGLIVIGGEGALVVGAVATVAAGAALAGAPSVAVITLMMLAGMGAGALWIGAAGWLRHYRGVNETIATLILNYIAIALMSQLVVGAMRDPAVVHRPSSWHVGEANMIGAIPGMDVHWGLALGVGVCVLLYILMQHTVFGFAAQIIGGNIRAARMSGIPVGLVTVVVCCLAGAAAGLAGAIEIAAVQGRASSSIVVGYGYTGILVAFVARQNPLAVIPVAILLGGIRASGGLLQRWHGLPDATVLVLQGIIFVLILASEPLYGRLHRLRARG